MKFPTKTNRRAPALMAAAVFGAVVTGGVAYATGIPGGDGVIQACYAKNGNLLAAKGSLRVVDDATACRKYEAPLSWNQKGLKGDPGPASTTGPQGPAGPAGETGPQVHLELEPLVGLGGWRIIGHNLNSAGASEVNIYMTKLDGTGVDRISVGYVKYGQTDFDGIWTGDVCAYKNFVAQGYPADNTAGGGLVMSDVEEIHPYCLHY